MPEWRSHWGRESATQQCPRCHRSFHVLADEVDTHPCPSCGHAPWEDGESYCDECDSETNHTGEQHRAARENDDEMD